MIVFQILKPMMLRRLKEDVEKNLAPKEETIVEVNTYVISEHLLALHLQYMVEANKCVPCWPVLSLQCSHD